MKGSCSRQVSHIWQKLSNDNERSRLCVALHMKGMEMKQRRKVGRSG